MNIWIEFKNSILPWLLAGAVVAFLIVIVIAINAAAWSTRRFGERMAG